MYGPASRKSNLGSVRVPELNPQDNRKAMGILLREGAAFGDTLDSGKIALLQLSRSRSTHLETRKHGHHH